MSCGNMKSQKGESIKIGVIGVGRGESFIQDYNRKFGMELVAICDKWEDKLSKIGGKYNVATYADYDSFLKHDMDAVILANYFHEHAPFAIKALRAGKHVLSETSSNITLAEGVALCREVEKSGKIYMLAENYPYTIFNQEMTKIYKNNEIGEVMYAEGEYNHSMEFEEGMKIAPGLDHWRNNMPSTYYCTHALAPLMMVTDLEPKEVFGLSIAFPQYTNPVRKSDRASVILCRMENGAIFRLTYGLPGHSIWYRFHCAKGAMENTRGPGYFGPEQVRIWRNEWELEDGQKRDMVYSPEWPENGGLIKGKIGHGGSDFWTNYHFAQAIRTNKQPYLDVYKGVTMSSVGILAWKSALQNGAPFEMPDFRDEESRKKYEQDDWCPFPDNEKTNSPYPSILGDIKINNQELKKAEEIWQQSDRGNE